MLGLVMRWMALLAYLLAAGCDSPAFPLIAQARARERAQAPAAEAQSAYEAQEAKCTRKIPPQVGNFSALSSCLAVARRALFEAKDLPSDLTELSKPIAS